MPKLCLAWLAVLAGLFLIAAALPPAGGGTNAADIPAIIFTQIPVEAAKVARPKAPGMLSAPWGEDARLVLLRDDRSIRMLTQGFDSAADPSVSFDGKHVLFAGKRSRSDTWNIFEMAADESDIRQITKGMGNCRKPIYQSALFYLNDARPSYQLAFVSDAAGEVLCLALTSINQTGRKDHVICGVDSSRSGGGVDRQPAWRQERGGHSPWHPGGSCRRHGGRLVVLYLRTRRCKRIQPLQPLRGRDRLVGLSAYLLHFQTLELISMQKRALRPSAVGYLIDG